MKPVYETKRQSNRLWLIPVMLVVVAVIGLPAVRKVFAQQGAAEAQQAALDRALRELVALKEQLRQSAAAPAVPAPPVQKWEYKIAGLEQDQLSRLGGEGWRVTAVEVDRTVLLERPVREGAARAAAADPKGEDKNIAAAKLTASTIKQAVNAYYLSIGSYPDALSHLVREPAGLVDTGKWKGPYVEGGIVPVDPWGRKFHFRRNFMTDEFHVESAGPDGSLETKEDNILVKG